MAFVTASAAVAFQQMTAAEQRKAVLDDLVLLGTGSRCPEELLLRTGTRKPGPQGHSPARTPGTWTTYGQGWQQSHGRVHWHRSSSRWPGYFEGAIELAFRPPQKRRPRSDLRRERRSGWRHSRLNGTSKYPGQRVACSVPARRPCHGGLARMSRTLSMHRESW